MGARLRQTLPIAVILAITIAACTSGATSEPSAAPPSVTPSASPEPATAVVENATSGTIEVRVRDGTQIVAVVDVEPGRAHRFDVSDFPQDPESTTARIQAYTDLVEIFSTRLPWTQIAVGNTNLVIERGEPTRASDEEFAAGGLIGDGHVLGREGDVLTVHLLRANRIVEVDLTRWTVFDCRNRDGDCQAFGPRLSTVGQEDWFCVSSVGVGTDGLVTGKATVNAPFACLPGGPVRTYD